MNNYRFLNLPKNPLINNFATIQNLLKSSEDNLARVGPGAQHNYECLTNVKDFISPDVLDIFQQLDLRPKFFACFAKKNISKLSIKDRQLHYDIFLDKKKKDWVSIPFAINWEITPGHTVFHWYDVPVEPGFPDKDREDLPLKELLAGTYYQSPGQRGLPNGTKLIEKVQVTGPILVKTSIPHSVSFDSTASTRYNISLRFEFDDAPSWEAALKKLEPLIVK